MHSRLDVLNNLYHSNSRQIDQLVRANGEISRAIVSLINREQNASREHPRQYASRARQQQNISYDSDVRDALLVMNDENTIRTVPNSSMLSSTAGRMTGRMMNGHTAPANSPYVVNREYTVPVTNQSTINRILESFLAPIDIYPSPAQIETATRIARYGDIIRPLNTTCPISLDSLGDDQLVTVIRHCGHAFNTEQINAWFLTNCRCPVCRYDIRNYSGSQHVLDVSANTSVNENNDVSTDEEQ